MENINYPDDRLDHGQSSLFRGGGGNANVKEEKRLRNDTLFPVGVGWPLAKTSQDAVMFILEDRKALHMCIHS